MTPLLVFSARGQVAQAIDEVGRRPEPQFAGRERVDLSQEDGSGWLAPPRQRPPVRRAVAPERWLAAAGLAFEPRSLL